MNLFVKRGLALAAVSAIAFSSSACGTITEAVDEAGKCTDLEAKVEEHAPDKDLTLSQTPKEDFAKLTEWMADNGDSVDDEKLGKAITDWGNYAAGYYYEEQGGTELTDEEWTAFEKASTTIDKACPDLGFGFDR